MSLLKRQLLELLLGIVIALVLAALAGCIGYFVLPHFLGRGA